jgi:hypothetical protein
MPNSNAWVVDVRLGRSDDDGSIFSVIQLPAGPLDGPAWAMFIGDGAKISGPRTRIDGYGIFRVVSLISGSERLQPSL